MIRFSELCKVIFSKNQFYIMILCRLFIPSKHRKITKSKFLTGNLQISDVGFSS